MKKTICMLLAALLLVGAGFYGCAPKAEDPDIIPPEEGDPIAEEIDYMIGYTSFETENGTKIAPVVDLQGHLTRYMTTVSVVAGQMNMLKSAGFTRVYIVVCNPGYPTFASAAVGPTDKGNLLLSISMLKNDPHKAYVDACHKLGMEVYAIYKPYEGGGGVTAPAGTQVKESVYQEETVGGTRLFFDSFISEHPELRTIRKPDGGYDEDSRPITSIELAFMADSYAQRRYRSARDSFEIFPKLTAAQAKKIMQTGINLWVSRDNGEYTLYEGGYDCKWTVEKRQVTNANGYPLKDGESECVILTVDGFSLDAEYKYVAVTFENTENMRTVPYSMINIFSGEEKLFCTVATHVRNPHPAGKEPDEYVWGRENEPVYGARISGIKVEDGKLIAEGRETDAQYFYKWGFEFNWFGSGSWGDGWMTSGVYGIARGKVKYLPGNLCEGYPEVRQFWLDTVKELLDDGFDGIDIRLQAHSSMISDYINYGYNEPIAQRYKELYGVDILTEEADPIKLMQVRGDFFVMFLEEAEELIHSRGKILQIHLRESYVNPVLDEDINEIAWWTMPKVIPDWRRCVELSDEITIKDYIYVNYDASAAKEIKEYAKSLDKIVWIHCYKGQADAFNEGFLKAADEDKLVDGILIYEVSFDYAFLNEVKNMMGAIGAREIQIKEPPVKDE